MEETTSWKNHSFTLLIFGGIVMLCSIFFVLGMLVGRNQGIKMAGALAEQEADKPVATVVADDSVLKYYSETKEDDPDFSLEPSPTPAAQPSPAAVNSGASTTAEVRAAADKQEAQKPPKPEIPQTPKTRAPSQQVYLQVMSTQDKKKADAERKKVESNGFKSKVLGATLKNERWHRVVVGPYKESEVNVARANLKAKGYNPVRAQE
jgi:cell division protein FtsN